jgi:hypothetical protein
MESITNHSAAHNEAVYENALHASRGMREDSIAYFKEYTSERNPKREALMGVLHDSHTPQAFSEVCQAFAKGMEYVKEKFGTQPSSISITDEPYDACRSDLDTYGVYIPRKFIEKILAREWHRQGKTEPFSLRTADMAMMIGVEEAFHVHQMTQNKERVETLLAQQNIPHDEGNPRYDQQPIEYEAMHVVHQAMKDLGVIERSLFCVNNVTPENVAWLGEEYLKSRTTPASANNTQPFTRGVVTISSEGLVTKTTQPTLAP